MEKINEEIGTTLFFGAGFSKWAVGLPVASEMFDFKIEPWGKREIYKLDLARSLKQSWDKKYPNREAEQFIAESLNFPQKEKEAVLWYIVRRLSEPFIWKEWHAGRWRRHILMIDEYRKYKIRGVQRAQKFIMKFSCVLSGIITTNYDILVEYALGTKGFNYGTRNQILLGRGPYPVSSWRNPVRLTGKIPLAKIHGSISWDQSGYYTDGRRAITGGALIIAPTPEKSIPDLLKQQWELAEKILRKTAHLVVFGFSFNQYDKAVLDLLRYPPKILNSVRLIDIRPPIEQAGTIWTNVKITNDLPP